MYSQNEGGVKIGTDTTIVNWNDHRLYARWIPNIYQITYNVNGGERGPAIQKGTYDTTINLTVQKPVKTGYTFKGWSLYPQAQNAEFASGSAYKIAGDTTFYAVWSIDNYQLAFDSNGGSGAPGTTGAVYNTYAKITTLKPYRSGFEFLGWSTNANAANPEYAPGDSVLLLSNTKLYAVWKRLSENGAGLKKQTITASSKTVAINSKAFNINAKTDGDGIITYKSDNTKVVKVGKTSGKVTVKGYGKTTVTITVSATAKYKAATKKITITVGPKKVSLKSVKSPKRKYLSVTWKKDSAVSGYQIYFSTNKNFKSGTYKRPFGKKTTGMKVSGLKSKKTYYVKIRAYKTVKGKKYYGSWSTVKKVKIK